MPHMQEKWKMHVKMGTINLKNVSKFIDWHMKTKNI